MSETCSERERLLSKWTESSRHLARVQDKELAAIKNVDASLAGFNEQIRLSKTQEIEACRAYCFHVSQHECV